MAGLYLHIPFCRQACHYCNFHFSTTLHLQQQVVDAIVKEIALQANFLPSTHLQSIYFGGGTPSLLTEAQLDQLFSAIHQHFTWDDNTEITLEANPDDLTTSTLMRLAYSPVNRLSIGTQSFHEKDLQLMNRAHTATEALSCIQAAQDYGYEAINIDLIYGMPGHTLADWQQNIDTFLGLHLPHLSSYCLTIEPKTALAYQIAQGKVILPDDETIATQYAYLHQQLKAEGYVHYEISNFALPGHLAQHNTNYWKGVPYLGVGPSAHSYKKGVRQWNISHNRKYVQAINAGTVPFEEENIDLATAFNEYLLTGLRTHWGVDLHHIASHFGKGVSTQLLHDAEPYLKSEQLLLDRQCLRFDPYAWLVSDGIISELFQ